MNAKRIHSALISVYNKDGLDEIATRLHSLGIVIYSTGGTQAYLEKLGIPVVAVEDITEYPSILGGRVKTLHPKVFGGILAIRNPDHLSQLAHFEIPLIDLVIVDLYPFQETRKTSTDHQEIIEKIDIGGISLIRAGAKNYEDVVIIPSAEQYPNILEILKNNAISQLEERKYLASAAFKLSSSYDAAIADYFDAGTKHKWPLRYGENPHQQAYFEGNLDECFEILSGKELSYNNILDLDAACNLMADFYEGPACFAVIKHTNVCGIAQRETISQAWLDALAGDPVSAFGGILICNKTLDIDTAQKINNLFYELLIAPAFEPGVVELLSAKKNRILVLLKKLPHQAWSSRTAINGFLNQEMDLHVQKPEALQNVTKRQATELEIKDLLFATTCAKHLKSNAITLVSKQQLIGMGCGQTSRVDACKQAIEKARSMGFDPAGSVMASEAFFPFPDCVELAANAGITAIIQPGGSVNDDKSIQKADELGIAMVFSGIRHFKH